MLSLPPTAADSAMETPEQTAEEPTSDEFLVDEKADEPPDEKEEADHTSEAGDNDDLINKLLG